MSQIATGAASGAAAGTLFGPIGTVVGAVAGAVLGGISAIGTNRALTGQARRLRTSTTLSRQNAENAYQLERLAAVQRGVLVRGSIRASAGERGFTGGSITDILNAQITSEAIDNQTRKINAGNRQQELEAAYRAALANLGSQSVNGALATAQGAIGGAQVGANLGNGIDSFNTAQATSDRTVGILRDLQQQSLPPVETRMGGEPLGQYY